jgi:hypothetical protein
MSPFASSPITMDVSSSCKPWMILRRRRRYFAAWFLHCHIDWHLEACVFIHTFPSVRNWNTVWISGLTIVFAEDVPDWNTTIAHKFAYVEGLFFVPQCVADSGIYMYSGLGPHLSRLRGAWRVRSLSSFEFKFIWFFVCLDW